jgi:formylmethanofuran dehydrogenase subunit E
VRGAVASSTEGVTTAPAEALYHVSEIRNHPWKDTPHTFETMVCGQCGEMVVERNTRVKGGKIVCIPCSGYEE